jgi:hypothetical protein
VYAAHQQLFVAMSSQVLPDQTVQIKSMLIHAGLHALNSLPAATHTQFNNNIHNTAEQTGAAIKA